MTKWIDVYHEAATHVRKLKKNGCDFPFFRGHADSRWMLKPELSRTKLVLKEIERIESCIYYDFISLGGPIANSGQSSWDTLFSMQHHGLPTRLLDWTSNFSVAIYFALNVQAERGSNPCVWILDPFELNRITCSDAVILTPPDDFEGSYYENFITNEKTFGHDVVAINPTRLTSRQLAQDSTFTVFGNLTKPLEEVAPQALKKIELSTRMRNEVEEFLRLSGITEYRLFPDLDGLSRYIKKIHWKNT